MAETRSILSPSPCSLVTGCGGFIGSHVADELLRRGHRVLGLDDLSGGLIENVPARVDFVRGSVGDVDIVGRLFREQRIDYVFHLAAYAAEGLSHFVRRFNYDNNVTSTMTLVNECVTAGTVRCFVFASSIAVYGHQPPPVSEATPPAPADPYAIAKYAVELDLRAARALFGLRSIILRLHNVYGERQNIADPYRNVIAIFMAQLMRGEAMTIFGDGSQTRSFTHIGDLAPVIAASVEREACYDRTINIGSDAVYAITDVARLTAEALGAPLRVRHLAERHEVLHANARHDLQKEYFGDLHAELPLPTGLARMAAWARTQPSRPTRLPAVEVARGLPPSWSGLEGI